MNKYYAFFTAAILISAIAHLFLKKGALQGKSKSPIHSLLNLYSVLGYTLMIIALFLSTFAMKTIPLINVSFLLPLQFILVIILSFVFLKEKITKPMIVGSLFIILGIIIFKLQT